MAYKTAEERHNKQNTHEGSFSLENKLMQYLRENYDTTTADRSLRSLEHIAMNYDSKVGIQRPADMYKKICQSVIDKYKKNWEYKEPGEDDRGGRLGETYDDQQTISNVLQGML